MGTQLTTSYTTSESPLSKLSLDQLTELLFSPEAPVVELGERELKFRSEEDIYKYFLEFEPTATLSEMEALVKFMKADPRFSCHFDEIDELFARKKEPVFGIIN